MFAVAVGFAVAVVWIAVAAFAEPVDSTTTVGQCRERGDVWLYVRTDDDRVLRNECVGAPASGFEALAAADVDTRESDGGYLCMLAGYPERCPSRFAGQYWQYWHASGPGTEWEYAKKGAGDAVPAAGSIEGWCYNARGEERCALPVLAAADGPTARVNLEPAGRPTQIWALGGIAVVLGVAFWWTRRRRQD